MALQTAKKWSLTLSFLMIGLLLGVSLTSFSQPSGPEEDASYSGGVPAKMVVKPSIPEVVSRISPAVVSVGAVKRTVVLDPYFDYFSPFFRQREMLQRVPYMGSGFLVDRKGHVLTNYHVIQDSDEIFVTLPNGNEYPAEIIETDRFIDVALLKIDAKESELPEPLPMGDSDSLMIGETVLALGNPFGNLIEDPRPSVTKGVVSALHRSFQPDRRNHRVYEDMIQTDAAINPGNSGGPLVDEEGRAIGLNTFIMSRDGGSSGLGFAIPMTRIRSFVDEVLEFGRLRRLLVDFDVISLETPRVRGVLISEMKDGGPAQDSGLEIGDVILSVDGREIQTRQDFILILASRQVGDELIFSVWRSGDRREVQYEIVEAPVSGRERMPTY